MKKILFTVFAVCIMFAASAQFKGGLKAGLNLANGSGDTADALDASMLTSFHVGVYGQFGLSDAITLQPELLYYGAGSKVAGGDFDLKLTYIAVPVMLKYNIGETFNLQAGPQIGFLMSADLDGTDVKDNLKGTDFGLNIGAGATFGKFSADARYSIGLSNIDDGGGTWKNNVIQISLGYQLFGGE